MSASNRRIRTPSTMLSSSNLAAAKKKHAVLSSENEIGGQGGGEGGRGRGRGMKIGGNDGEGTVAVKPRVPLGDLTNRHRGGSSLVPCSAAKHVQGKNTSISSTSSSKSTLRTSSTTSNVKSASGLPSKTSFPRSEENVSQTVAIAAPCSMDISPSLSDGRTIDMDESISTCESLKFSDIELLDENDLAASKSRESISCRRYITEGDGQTGESMCERDGTNKDDKVVNVDYNLMDPQLCATIACHIYDYLHLLEATRRPLADYMEKIQKDINASMRSILVDWLVEVAGEYNLIPETLYLTVNCIDRYLSGNALNRSRLQLLGVSCMMIAAKFEEIYTPHIEEFCSITDNTYFKEEVLQMESAVLNLLKFDVSAPTTVCFVRRFVQAAQASNEAPSLLLECLCYYISELSLLEYRILRYAPSLVAASTVFLAKYIVNPSQRPWNSTLRHHTHYDAHNLGDCVTDLHKLFLSIRSSNLRAIRDKYSQHKYKFVAKKYCPSTIPADYFLT